MANRPPWPPRPTGPVDRRDVDKLALFRQQSHNDATDPRVIALATRLARAHAPDDWIGIVREIHRFVRDGIRFQNDPNRRQWMVPAGETLETGWGNCVGKTILVVALLRALGLEAEVFPVWTGPAMLHIVYRVRYAGVRRTPGVAPDGWLYGEQTIKGAEPGQDPFTIGINPDTGSLPLSGGGE